MFQSKYSNYWKFTIQTNANNSRSLWSKLRCLLQPPADESSPSHSADDFADFFTSKIDKIRETTASAQQPVIAARPVAEKLIAFRPVTAQEITTLIKKSPSKHCALDPIPTWLLKQVSHVLAPIIASLCNASLTEHFLPDSHKKAIVHPLLKKTSLDQYDLNSYRPISNLSFLSKILERAVSSRLTDHIDRHDLLPVSQSAYRRHHSTETALLRLHNDIIKAIDNGDVCALVLLDLTAAFDTVDHKILIDILHDRFGIESDVLKWMTSYLDNRSQVVSVGRNLSSVRTLPCGVPQGSVLGPQEFSIYSEDVVEIFQSHRVSHHGYADDNQGLTHSRPADVQPITTALQQTVEDVGCWCDSRRLQLNKQKTELIWFGTSRALDKINPADKRLQFNNGMTIEPAEAVRNLGVFFDSELTMRVHISRLTRTCYYQLRRLRSIRRQLGRNIAQQLVSMFVLSRLDYCNALFANLPDITLAPLQRVQNAAARLVMGLKPWDHITESLMELHWLPIKFRIIYKLCLLVYRSLNRLAPPYLTELLHLVSNIESRTSLRSAAHYDLDVPSTNHSIGDRAFSVAGARHWNDLPVELRAVNNLSAFKKQLKTYLFRKAFCVS